MHNSVIVGLEGSAAPGQSTCSIVYAKSVPVCACVMIYSLSKPNIWMYSSVYIFYFPAGCSPEGGRKHGDSVMKRKHDILTHRLQLSGRHMGCYCCFLACCHIGPMVMFHFARMPKSTAWVHRVLHPIGHLCPGYMSVIFGYLSRVREGEGIRAITFYSTSGYCKGYRCKSPILCFYWSCLTQEQ